MTNEREPNKKLFLIFRAQRDEHRPTADVRHYSIPDEGDAMDTNRCREEPSDAVRPAGVREMNANSTTIKTRKARHCHPSLTFIDAVLAGEFQTLKARTVPGLLP